MARPRKATGLSAEQRRLLTVKPAMIDLPTLDTPHDERVMLVRAAMDGNFERCLIVTCTASKAAPTVLWPDDVKRFLGMLPARDERTVA